MNGKGSRPRPIDKQKYDRNYDRIFGPKKDSKREDQTPKPQPSTPNHQ